MKILVCFKIVPDLDTLSDSDFIADENLLVDTSFVKTIWNCFDESALEMMLKVSDLSEAFNISLQLNALTIGCDLCDPYLKTLYALGFEKAVRIDYKEDLRFSSLLTSRLITEYVRQSGGQDIIVTGKESSDGNNGQTPLLIAEMLGIPCITEVIKIEPYDSTRLFVTSEVEDGISSRLVEPPIVLAVGNAQQSYLRVPTLKDRMSSSKKKIDIVDATCCNVLKDPFITNSSAKPCCTIENPSHEDSLRTDSSTKLLHLSGVDNRREGIIIEGDSIKEKVDILYKTYLKGRLEQL